MTSGLFVTGAASLNETPQKVVRTIVKPPFAFAQNRVKMWGLGGSVQEPARCRRVARFENFEVDLRSGGFRRDGGNTIRFPEQPFRILIMLLERPGDVYCALSTVHRRQLG